MVGGEGISLNTCHAAHTSCQVHLQDAEGFRRQSLAQLRGTMASRIGLWETKVVVQDKGGPLNSFAQCLAANTDVCARY